MLMIQNNLDPEVAQHPHELITYGGNGTVFQNWAQYRLTMRYLAGMTTSRRWCSTPAIPWACSPPPRKAPRLVLTCGMVVGSHNRPEDYARLARWGSPPTDR
jgi:urocanate hydratase